MLIWACVNVNAGWTKQPPAIAGGCLVDLKTDKKRKNAETCYWRLLNEGQKHGYLPYRVGIQSMVWLSKNNSTYWQFVREIKKVIDPDSIISPGRYV